MESDSESDFDVTPVIATTRLVRETIFTIESLHNSAASVNDRERKPPMLAEHDHLCPPLGQIVRCKVVPIEDGHHALVGEYDIFPAPVAIELPDGNPGFVQGSDAHSFPFATGEFHHPDSFCISTDSTNFGGIDGVNTFFEEIKTDECCEFETQAIERRSILPDPELIINLGLQASAGWFGVRIAKASADAIEPELAKLFGVMIEAIKNIALNAIPKNRPVMYVLRVHGKPNLEFIAKTRDADAVISAMVNDDMSSLRPQISALKDTYNAEMIQFVLGTDGKWDFNFLLTKDGKVIGTRKAFDKRAVVLKSQKEKRKKDKKRKK